MISEMFFIRTSLPCALILSAFVLLYPTATTLAMILAVTVHESGHIAAMLALGEHIDSMRVTPFGLIIYRRRHTTTRMRELTIDISGPLANLVCSLILLPTGRGYIEYFASYCLFFGLLNLLPISSLDGGKAMLLLLETYLDISRAVFLQKLISLLLLLILWVYAVLCILYGIGGGSLLCFCIWLFASLFLKKERS